jgi:hypothetical protein
LASWKVKEIRVLDAMSRIALDHLRARLQNVAGDGLERVMNLGKSRIEMRISRSAWFPRDLCFLHS